jgi:hypothetical protein
MILIPMIPILMKAMILMNDPDLDEGYDLDE